MTYVELQCATSFCFLRGASHPEELVMTAAALASTAFLQYPSAVAKAAMPVTATWVAGPVLAWAVEQRVAAGLNFEFGTSFVGRPADQIDCCVEVDRQRQLAAITCHASQAHDNPVLWRRLELQGNREVFRWLDRAAENRGRAGDEVRKNLAMRAAS